MSFGELLANLLGWLGDFVQWMFAWVPRYAIIQINQRGVRYPRGQDAIELEPGIHWYIPNLTQIVKHHVSRCVLHVDPLSLETADSPPRPVQVGMVLTYHITNVLQYEVENFDADESMKEVAQGALQDIVTSSRWEELRGATGEGTRLGKKLASRMSKTLDRFGVEIESCRPTDLISLSRAWRIFGADHNINFNQTPR